MIRVLVVDDSAYSRQSIKSMLESTGEIQVVDVATDGDEALKLTDAHRPDVITLDLDMPRINGFAFLRILMSRRPSPVIVVSSNSSRKDVLRALDLGALDFVAKPSRTASKTLWSIRNELVAKVREAASARMDLYLEDSCSDDVTGIHSLTALENHFNDTQPITIPPLPRKDNRATEQEEVVAPLEPPPLSATKVSLGPPGTDGILLIGTSTGGPRALRKILGSLAEECPWPIAVAQHMPPAFTKDFANRLSRKLDLDIQEAADGSPLTPGKILIAPGGFHMTIAKQNSKPIVRLRVPDPNDRYVPSVDTLFKSATTVFGTRVIGVILTGMGSDGTEGARAIRYSGGKIVAEDQSTAVVFGMPQKAIKKGVVDVIAPLDSISSSVRWLIAKLRQNGSTSN